MPFNKKKLLSRSFITIALLSLFNYIFAHLAYMNMNTDAGLIYEYVTLYIAKITTFIIPVAVSILTVAVYAYEGARSAALSALILSAARLFYYLPYYYLIFILNYSYDSVESIALSLISCLGNVAFTVLFAFVAIYLSRLVLTKQNRDKKDFSARDHIRASFEKPQPLSDITDGANLTFLISSLLGLVSCIIPEIIDTVSFFLDYGFDYIISEILTIMLNYLLIFALTIGAYLLAAYLKNRFLVSHNDSE